MDYEFGVIGAGPMGSYVAAGLARLGHSVVLLEKKETIGKDVCCSGIISDDCLHNYCPDAPVLNTSRSATFYGPSGPSFRLSRDQVQAYIMDRSRFDAVMADKAVTAGASLIKSAWVKEIVRDAAGWSLGGTGNVPRDVHCRCLVLACGFNSSFTKAAGLGAIRSYLLAAQAEVATSCKEVQVHFDQDIAPSGFAWLIPTSEGKGLAGLMSVRSPRKQLESFLRQLEGLRQIEPGPREVRQKVVPMNALSSTVADGVIAVGEAAGQVKPTTGGGIYFGLMCAEAAVEILHKAAGAGSFKKNALAEYERLWRARVGREIAFGAYARRVYSHLSNRGIERLVEHANRSGIGQELVDSARYSFDRHSAMVAGLAGKPGTALVLAAHLAVPCARAVFR